MTGIGAITQGWDVASIIFTLFILFFISLVYHLTLESKREGRTKACESNLLSEYYKHTIIPCLRDLKTLNLQALAVY